MTEPITVIVSTALADAIEKADQEPVRDLPRLSALLTEPTVFDE